MIPLVLYTITWNVGNRAEESGGAVHLEDNCTLSATYLNVSGNTAKSGGGFYIKDFSNASFSSCSFRNNIAESFGEAIMLFVNSSLAIVNSTLEGMD